MTGFSMGKLEGYINNRIFPLLLAIAALTISIYVCVYALSLNPSSVVMKGYPAKFIFLLRTTLIIFFATWLLEKTDRSWKTVGLRQTSLSRSVFIVPLGLFFALITVGLTNYIITRLGIPTASYLAFKEIRGNTQEYLFWLLPVSIGSAAFGEEMIFRGFYLDTFRHIFHNAEYGLALSVILQAIMFGLMHGYQGIGGVISNFVSGIVLGLIFIFSKKNICNCILIHGMMDMIGITGLYTGHVS